MLYPSAASAVAPARVRALEEKIPSVERPVRKYLPPGVELPSKAVGEGTLLSRVAALERAMEALLRAQVCGSGGAAGLMAKRWC